MISDKNKAQKDPSQEDIKFILELFNSNKFIDAKKEVDKQITKYPNSFILFNILGAILSEQKHLDEAVENYKKSIKTPFFGLFHTKLEFKKDDLETLLFNMYSQIIKNEPNIRISILSFGNCS